MSFFGVQLNSQINRLILEIKLKLSQNKLSPNFRTIYRSLAQHDPNITGLISSSLFQKSLNENGFFFKKFQIQALQKGFPGQGGLINWFNFLEKLRQPMGPVRREIVEGIFYQISKGKDQITVEQLYQNFNSEGCDSFKKVVKDQKANFNNFINLLHIDNDKLSREEFVSYYNDLNANFPEDETFVRYICNQWKCQPRIIQKFNQQQVKSAIKSLRFKLIQKTNGTKDQFLLQKAFSEFDQNKSGAIGSYQLDLMLKKLELPTPSKLITPLLQTLDKNKSGYIQYEQFKRFLFFDPFLK